MKTNLLLSLLVLGAALARAEETPPQAAAPAQASTTSIPFDQLGAEAQKKYSGDGISITPTVEGARLKAAFQKLEGQATREGLWLTSTAEESIGKAERFRVQASEVGRRRGDESLSSGKGASGAEGETAETPNVVPYQSETPHVVSYRLPATGTVQVAPDMAMFIRPGVVEEYRVSMDGVRQDFIVVDRPSGSGDLSVMLDVSGATAEAATYGARLTLAGSDRAIAYSRLHVTDARGKELTARLEVAAANRLRVVVADADAAYPVRIDPTFSDANWISMGVTPGANGTVRAAVVDASGNLYIGGDFTIVGDVMANHVAKWNGSMWSALGWGAGSSRVNALAVSGSDLYASGDYYVHKWDGSGWSDIGYFGYQSVKALAVSGSDLYVGGYFTTAGGAPGNKVAKWNGSAWSALGSGVAGAYAEVVALAVSGSDLYVGGDFDTAGGSPAANVAKWNGTAWSALGSGAGTYVNALAVSGSSVYAGHFFGLSKWDGSGWSNVGPGITNVTALAVSGSDLYVGGRVNYDYKVAKLSGTTWSYSGVVNQGRGYGIALAVSGSDIYLGGDFTQVAGSGASNVAKWSGSAWSAMVPGSGISGPVHAVAVSGADLYVAGDFGIAGTPVAYVAKWSGSAWSGLGSGVNDYVEALAVSGSDLYVGGNFTTAGGNPANRVAKWNGSAWSALGSGVGADSSAVVHGLAVSGSDLYVGGYFITANGAPGNNVAKWNGTVWSALGSGLQYGQYGSNGAVYALAVSGSDLYAGGNFTTANGNPANYVAKWNGSAWSAMGSGLGGQVYALAVSGSDLYAGGSFTTADGNPANCVAKWNGSAWSALGLGLNGDVYALAVSGTDLYVGGWFGTAGGSPSGDVAKWNGSAWSGMGSGPSGYVKALVMYSGELYVGGAFSTIGGKFSANLARGQFVNFAPDVTTSAATLVSLTTATLNGTVNPLGSVSTAQFEYGLNTYYGSTASVTLSPTDGTTVQTVSSALTGLTPGATYYFRLSATNGTGTAVTTASTFVMSPPVPPTVSTAAATAVTSAGATLNGSVNPNGATTTAWFQYGLTTSYTHSTIITLSPSNGITLQTVNKAITGLASATTYHYRITATNAGGTSNGDDMTFTTPAVPEIAVEQPAGTNRADGASIPSFGGFLIGTSAAAKVFTIKNLGTADLTLGAITQNGTNPADFIVNTSGMLTTIIPGGSTTFTVTFAPGGTDSSTRNAAIHIANNDADENPFDLNLSGQGFSGTADTDSDGLNDWAEYQYSTLGFNWQVGQTALVNTLYSGANAAGLYNQAQYTGSYAAGQTAGQNAVIADPNPHGLYTMSQLQALNVGTPLLSKNATTGLFTVTIGLEKSTDLSTFQPFPMTGAGTTTVINGQGKIEFQFSVPDNAAFFQLKAQ